MRLAPLLLVGTVACTGEVKGFAFDPDAPLYSPQATSDGADGTSDSTDSAAGGDPTEPGTAVTGELEITNSFGDSYGTWTILGETIACGDCTWGFAGEFSGPSFAELTVLFRSSGGASVNVYLQSYDYYYGYSYEMFWGTGTSSGGTAVWEHDTGSYYSDYYSYGYIYTGQVSY